MDEARLLRDLVYVRRDLRTLVARDDEGLGWDDAHAAYLLGLESQAVALLGSLS